MNRPLLLAIEVGTLSMHAVPFDPEIAAGLHADRFATGTIPRDQHVYGSDTAWFKAQAAACSGPSPTGHHQGTHET
jgi:hypothetical protein